MTVKVEVCDTCLISAYDDGVHVDDAQEVMAEIGGDWADHLCDEVETDGEIKCGCACRFNRKRR